jgi:hypothetical protein
MSTPPAPVADPIADVRELMFAPPAPAPWKDDRAFETSAAGDDFVEWFERTSVTDADAWCRVDAVPVSRIYEIADEARRRSELWMRIARSLEDRTRKRR